MRVAIATDAENVSAHFGRCGSYTLVDFADGKIIKKEVLANPGHAPGAIPQYLHEHGVDRIVCGGMGTRAAELFALMGMEMVTGIQGSVDDAVRKMADGTLTGGESLCAPGAGRGYGVEKTECDHAHD